MKELVEPEGAVIFTKRFQLGDPTINTLELWGAEYQESDALLCRKEDVELLQEIADRERCPVCFVGVVMDDGKVFIFFATKKLATLCEILEFGHTRSSFLSKRTKRRDRLKSLLSSSLRFTKIRIQWTWI